MSQIYIQNWAFKSTSELTISYDVLIFVSLRHLFLTHCLYNCFKKQKSVYKEGERQLKGAAFSAELMTQSKFRLRYISTPLTEAVA